MTQGTPGRIADNPGAAQGRIADNPGPCSLDCYRLLANWRCYILFAVCFYLFVVSLILFLLCYLLPLLRFARVNLSTPLLNLSHNHSTSAGSVLTARGCHCVSVHPVLLHFLSI